MKLRLSPQTLLVIDAFLQQAEEWKYGYDLSRVTGLKSGTLYPILMRMADRKLLETEWEPGEPGRPPRHMYRFTPEGLRFARANVAVNAGSGLGQLASGQVALGQVALGHAALSLISSGPNPVAA
jgi:PadR family transcriptional regulator, regulatory protein PadR